MDSLYSVTLDRRGFDRKPEGREIAGITRRMQQSGPTEVTADELARAIVGGATWCGGCYAPSAKGWGEFRGARLFGIDFDNDAVVRDENGNPAKGEDGRTLKRSLLPDESGYIDPWECLNRFNKYFHVDPLMMYESFKFSFDRSLEGRWNPETRMRYRVIFDAGEVVTEEAEAAKVAESLLQVFPEADQSCSNVNRLYFGTCGRLVLFGEGGARFYYGDR